MHFDARAAKQLRSSTRRWACRCQSLWPRSESDQEESPVAHAPVALKTAASSKARTAKQRPRVRAPAAPAVPAALDRDDDESEDAEDSEADDAAELMMIQKFLKQRKQKGGSQAEKESRKRVDHASNAKLDELTAVVRSVDEEFKSAVKEAEASVRAELKKLEGRGHSRDVRQGPRRARTRQHTRPRVEKVRRRETGIAKRL